MSSHHVQQCVCVCVCRCVFFTLLLWSLLGCELSRPKSSEASGLEGGKQHYKRARETAALKKSAC
eukprot:4917439-Amphidinium_carterae.1